MHIGIKTLTGLATVALAAGMVLGVSAGGASAAPRHGVSSAGHRMQAGVRFAARPMRGGSALVSDGPGTGFGFHRLPAQFRVGALVHRERQAAALHEAVESDALTSGGWRSGYLGSDTAANVPYSHYGVFSGADGYGSPFFAGYYGPGDGADLGPLGHTYE